MKHFLFFCLFVSCCSAACIAQKVDFTQVYYPNINAAEMAITRQEFTVALSHYKMAFESVQSGFAHDYRNAILCAIRTNDDGFAFKYLEKMVLKGFDKAFLSDTIFKPLTAKKAWGKLLASYDALHQKHVNSINGKLLAELVAMGDRDQVFRVKEGSYEVYGDTIAKIDVENVLRFQQIVNEYGFPSEEMIGAFGTPQQGPYNIILHHHAQNISNKAYAHPVAPSLASAIVLAAKEGKCSPAHAGFLLSMQNDPSLRYYAWGIHQVSVGGEVYPYYLLERYPPKQLNAINELRAGIGLESMDDYRMKCQFRLDYPNTPFRLSGYENRNVWEMDEEMAKIFVQDFEKLTPTLGK